MASFAERGSYAGTPEDGPAAGVELIGVEGMDCEEVREGERVSSLALSSPFSVSVTLPMRVENAPAMTCDQG